MIRRGVADTSYAAIASAALVAGLLLLSFSGGIFSLTGQAPGDPGGGGLDPDLQEVDLPNGSIDPGEYVDNETIDAATREDGIVTRLARGLFEFFSGQDIEPPDLPAINGSDGRRPAPGDGSVNGTGGGQPNATEGGAADGTNTTDGSGSPETNVSDGGSGTGEGPDGTNATDPGDDQQSPNGTGADDDGAGNDTSIPDRNGTTGQEPSMADNTSGSGGFVADMVERFSELFSGGTQDQGQAGDGDGEDATDGPDGRDGGGGLPGISAFRALLVPLLAIGAVVAGLLVYRSDRGWRELVSALLSWARSAVRQLPDIARRVIVGAVSVVVSTLLAAGSVLWRFIHAPMTVARETREALARRLRAFQEALAGMRERSVRETAAMILGEGAESPEGLDRIWIELKEALGLDRDTSLTPLEVGREAIDQGFHAETIQEIVAALRAEKYAPEGYGDKMRIGRWERALWGDSGG